MPKTIADRWAEDDQRRQPILDNARDFATICGKSYILPWPGTQPGELVTNPSSSKASLGVTNLVGKLMPNIWPSGMPFFSLDLKPELRFSIDPKQYQKYATALYIQSLKIMAMLESAPLLGRGNRPSRSLRLSKRSVIQQAAITGDVLECLMPDYRVRKFRNDNYVTKRDAEGSVLYHIVREKIDPRTLTDEQFAKTKLDPKKFKKGEPAEEDSFLLYEYNPRTKKWVMQQEMNGHVYNEAEHDVSRFFATAWELTEGEDYGHGFIELNRGDLFSHDELTGRMLDWAGNASKMLWVLDAASNIRPGDLQLNSGCVIEGGNVKSGAEQGVALLKADKMSDFNVANVVLERLEKNLSKAMLMELDSAPTGEAGRHSTGWKVMLNQLQGMTGDAYAAIADEQQRPLVLAVMDQMRVDKLIDPKLPDIVQVSSTTGMEAVSRQQKLASVLDFSTVLAKFAQFEPGVLRRLDFGVWTDIVARLHQIDEPGLVKSAEQTEQETAQAQAAQAKQELVSQAIKSSGNIAENAAAQSAA